jgi:hypothetical protein
VISAWWWAGLAVAVVAAALLAPADRVLRDEHAALRRVTRRVRAVRAGLATPTAVPPRTEPPWTAPPV